MKNFKYVALSIVIMLIVTFTLSSCSTKPSGPYTVKLYSGGEIVQEWNGVSNFSRSGDQYIILGIDDEKIAINGGTLVIESEKTNEER